MFTMPGSSYRGPLPPLTDDERQIAERLEAHVRMLAETIGARNVHSYPDELAAAAEYIRSTWRELGYAVRSHPYAVGDATAENLAAARADAVAEGVYVVGAHYDSVGDCPAANDNGSGVAAMLELSRLLADSPAARRLRFVAFVNEEPPYFQTPRMGSWVYAKECRARGEKLAGMFSLETMGCYHDEPGSQAYPFPFSLFYPDTGNFIGFVGNLDSRDLGHRGIAAFRAHAQFPSEGVAAPGRVTGIGLSDHWSFWQEGYPAVMITDTAPFRYSHYHLASDTPDKLDYERLARVVSGLSAMLEDLAAE